MAIEIAEYNLQVFKKFTCSRNFENFEEDGTTPAPFEGTDELVFFMRIGTFTLGFDSDGDPSANGSKVVFIDRDGGTYRLLLTNEDTALMPVTSETVTGSYYIGRKRPTSDAEDVAGRIDPLLKGSVTVELIA